MYQKIIRKICLITWSLWEKLGFYIVPKHFYYPIPPSNNLSKYNFDSQFPTTGLSIDDNIMKNLMYKIREYNEEYKPIYKSSGYESNGDGSILWGMIRIFKPNLIVEVGSGNSTRVALNAMDLNNQEKAKLGGGICNRALSQERITRVAKKMADTASIE